AHPQRRLPRDARGRGRLGGLPRQGRRVRRRHPRRGGVGSAGAEDPEDAPRPDCRRHPSPGYFSRRGPRGRAVVVYFQALIPEEETIRRSSEVVEQGGVARMTSYSTSRKSPDFKTYRPPGAQRPPAAENKIRRLWIACLALSAGPAVFALGYPPLKPHPEGFQ